MNTERIVATPWRLWMREHTTVLRNTYSAVSLCVCVEVAINNMATVQTGYALRVDAP
jgi:hypothetical protein